MMRKISFAVLLLAVFGASNARAADDTPLESLGSQLADALTSTALDKLLKLPYSPKVSPSSYSPSPVPYSSPSPTPYSPSVSPSSYSPSPAPYSPTPYSPSVSPSSYSPTPYSPSSPYWAPSSPYPLNRGRRLFGVNLRA
ncbi:hypothetical protein APUTEX25_001498 [Auxenochlorella protothecoides]|uniref:Uncharacterized protein n=1 Tax=Auxenochlorella protothecoides TaxID=3075 RepID=A0A3M7KX44_AUXPR|nr:hypothetical protein APUTEX25_001498 [Auxenochlorella protothecoides]|eukprot:RMZ54340.1 hypothetical protein APUTEX25_001498 [Auxenochlorella protothecoides]